MNFNPKPPELGEKGEEENSGMEKNEEFDGGSLSTTSLAAFPLPPTATENHQNYIPHLFKLPAVVSQPINTASTPEVSAAVASYHQQQHMLHQQASASIQMLEKTAAGLAAGKQSSAGSHPPMSKSTPDFVKKLYGILEDENNKETICWSHSADSVIILNPTLFASVVLPLHFKHNKFASFVRQLNKHNFHRVKMSADNSYGELACEYKHPMFRRDRHDLLEKICRQQSKSAASSALSTTFPNEKDTSPAASSLHDTRNDASFDRLSQGQKTSFYQMKDLERRVDFFEKELANCVHVVELQARLIKDLLFILPTEVRSHPEVLSLVNDLKWNTPAVPNPGKYGKIPMMQSSMPSSNFTSYNSAVSSHMQHQQHQLTQKQHNINQQQQQLNHQQEQLNTQMSNQNSIQQQQHIHQNSRDTQDWWSKSLESTQTDAYTSHPHHPFNNHDAGQGMGSPWNSTIVPPFSAESAASSLNYLPLPVPSTTAATGLSSLRVPESFQSLNVLIFVGSTREQRQLSDVLLELSCLSFKYAVDISHVFSCLDDKSEVYHIVILDQVHESYSLITRLRQSNSQLVVVFLTDTHQDPTPPPAEKSDKTLSLSKPVTLSSARHCLTKCLEYYHS